MATAHNHGDVAADGYVSATALIASRLLEWTDHRRSDGRWATFPVLADRAWCLNPVDGHADEPWMAIECTPVYTARDRLQGGTPDMEILVELVDGLGLGVSDARAAVRAAHVLNRPTAERPPDTP